MLPMACVLWSMVAISTSSVFRTSIISIQQTKELLNQNTEFKTTDSNQLSSFDGSQNEVLLLPILPTILPIEGSAEKA